MAWSEKFFTQRRLTSKLKHFVLQRYVKEFALHLGSVRPLVYYVDGFAGAGVYEHGDVREDGSPLLIAKLAEHIKTWQRPFDIRCLNVESNRKRFNSLQAATAPYRPEIVEENFHASFVDVVPTILNRIGESPAFFFIDPFGTKGVAFSDLLPIFKRQWTTEVLITFQTDGIAKKAGWFRKEHSADLVERENARRLLDHLAAALNTSLAQLREGWQETGAHGDTEKFEARAISYYLRQLRSSKTKFEYVKPFKVSYYDPDEPFRATPVCFHLVFATQRDIGLFKMNDAMADALQAFYAETYRANLFEQTVGEYERDEGRKALQKTIRDHFGPKPSFTIDDVKRHGMQTDYVLLKGGEYRKVVVEMAKTELEKLDPGPLKNAVTRYRFKKPNAR